MTDLVPGRSGSALIGTRLRREMMHQYGRQCRVVTMHTSHIFHGRLLVVDSIGGIRYLSTIGRDGRILAQSAMDRRHRERLVFEYERLMALAFALSPGADAAVLLLGLGGGDMARYASRHFPKCRLTIVEKDPLVAAIARRYFGIRHRIRIEDALIHLLHGDAAYDLIFLDLYDGKGLFADSLSLWQRAIAALRRPGWLAVNWAEFSGNRQIRERATALSTLAATTVYLTSARDPDNMVQIISPTRMTLQEVAARISSAGAKGPAGGGPLENCWLDSEYPGPEGG